MSRYYALTDFLNQQPTSEVEVHLSFVTLERLVGPLPPSARKYRPWWANSDSSQSSAWRKAGWIVGAVNLAAGSVAFVRGIPSQRSTPLPDRDNLAKPSPTGTRSSVDTEEAVQARLVNFLARTGWHIERVANTATREAGIDVLVTKEQRTLAVEVKGYPSTSYADPRRSLEIKPTNPSTQARHWYAQALLKAMLTRDEMPSYEIAIGLPDAGTYRSLQRRTARSLEALSIRVLFVLADGRVVHANNDDSGVDRLFA